MSTAAEHTKNIGGRLKAFRLENSLFVMLYRKVACLLGVPHKLNTRKGNA